MKKDGDKIITPSDTGKFPDIYTAKTDRNRNVQYYNIWSSPSRTGGPKCKSAYTEYQVPGVSGFAEALADCTEIDNNSNSLSQSEPKTGMGVLTHCIG
jgi:hypothetical protein